MKETENARLREALDAIEHKAQERTQSWVDAVQHMLDCKAIAGKALSETDGGWLTRHDEEVREQYVEKCNKVAERYASIPEEGERGLRAGVAAICKNVALECIVAIRSD